jgi:hypothetical protein
MTPEYDIAVLLPTRGRTTTLGRSIHSVINLADRPERLQLMFAFDNDDTLGIEYFTTELQPWLDEREIDYTAMQMQRQGYHRLNVYNNILAKQADAHWFMCWNDDAVMETQGWDTEIMKYQGQFKLLAVHTHRDHPYSIFPIVPRKWYELLGYLSPHSVGDAWLSQQAYMLDIWERIPVWALHDRADITGNNDDDTYKERAQLEGRPMDENDFHSVQQMEIRHRDCATLATYMHEQGLSTEFFRRIWTGEQDPWEKLARNDVNRQMVQFDNPHKHFGKNL